MQAFRPFRLRPRHICRAPDAVAGYLKQQQCMFRMSAVTLDVNSDFEAAKSKLNSSKAEPGNDVKLKLYALYKQATTGANTTSKPGALDFVAKAKWNAWSGLKDLSQDDAKRQYVSEIENLVGSSGKNDGNDDRMQNSSHSSSSGGGDYEELLYETHDNLTVITLNRPSKRNAWSIKAYYEFVAALQRAADDPNCRIVALTGSGDFYSSGNDLGNFAAAMKKGGTVEDMAKSQRPTLDAFTSAFATFPKPLVALVNGPAVGLSVTTLALCDVVYASDSASFHTPFAVLGQTPEGSSSYTFPLSMGLSNANEMLLLGRKISVQQALQRGLVSEIFPHDSFKQETLQILSQIAKSFADVPESLLDCKRVLRRPHKDLLAQVQDFESETLTKRWTHPECVNAISKFMTRKK